jgi:hypothetical protein
MAGTLLFMAVALLPAAALALAVWLPLRGGLGDWAFTPAALGASLALWAEVTVVVILLGDHYDALDPAEAGLLR